MNKSCGEDEFIVESMFYHTIYQLIYFIAWDIMAPTSKQQELFTRGHAGGLWYEDYVLNEM